MLCLTWEHFLENKHQESLICEEKFKDFNFVLVSEHGVVLNLAEEEVELVAVIFCRWFPFDDLFAHRLNAFEKETLQIVAYYILGQLISDDFLEFFF